MQQRRRLRHSKNTKRTLRRSRQTNRQKRVPKQGRNRSRSTQRATRPLRGRQTLSNAKSHQWWRKSQRHKTRPSSRHQNHPRRNLLPNMWWKQLRTHPLCLRSNWRKKPYPQEEKGRLEITRRLRQAPAAKRTVKIAPNTSIILLHSLGKANSMSSSWVNHSSEFAPLTGFRRVLLTIRTAAIAHLCLELFERYFPA